MSDNVTEIVFCSTFAVCFGFLFVFVLCSFGPQEKKTVELSELAMNSDLNDRVVNEKPIRLDFQFRK